MIANKSSEKPCVLIYVIPHPDFEQKLREVKAGMEEEGIPCTVIKSQGSDVIDLAYQGAGYSQLGVGIGIGAAGMSIHYQKLPPREPLFVSTTAGTPSEWRYFGYNAARLVKGIPFKEMSKMKANQPQLDDLAELVRSVIARVLTDTEKAMGR